MLHCVWYYTLILMFTLQLSVVIHELLVLEVWRQNVLPLILSRYSSRAKASFPTYIVVSIS